MFGGGGGGGGAGAGGGSSSNNDSSSNQQQQPWGGAGAAPANPPPPVRVAGDALAVANPLNGGGGGGHAGAPAPAPQRPASAASNTLAKRRGGPFAAQAGALFRKNAVFQRRNWCSNCCLLSAPVFFCLLLFGTQLAVNKLLFTGADYECGCACTRCCVDGDPARCEPWPAGVCPHACLEHDKARCGVQYSTPRQSPFCAIPHPTAWPAVLQVPAPDVRAMPWRPDPVLMHTGEDALETQALAAGMLRPPALTLPRLLAAQRYVQQFNRTFGPDAGAIPAEVLSLLGLTLGSSARMGSTLYIEPAVAGRESLMALWPAGTCAEVLGLPPGRNVTLGEMVSAMVNASNTPAAAAAVNMQLQGLLGGASSASASGGAGAPSSSASSPSVLDVSSPLALVTALQLNCTDVAEALFATPADLQRRLYCGYRNARCREDSAAAAAATAAAAAGAENATTAAAGGAPLSGQENEVAAAFDWRATSASSFDVDVYYNDTYGIPKGQAPTVYQRVPQALNLAVNAWLRRHLGSGYSAELVAVMETPKAGTSLQLDFSSLLGPLFYTWVAQMLLPVFLMQLVYEKERKLRMMMKMHGLGDGAYWLVTYLWFLALYVLYMAVFVAFGAAIGLQVFRKNSLAVQAVFYFVFGNTMIALAFLLSCFFASSKTATVFAYLIVFGSGLVGYLLLTRLVTSGARYAVLLELFPPFALYRGLFELGEYAFLGVYRGGRGMTWAALSEPRNGMREAWIILAAEWLVFMLLAWYLEQVVSAGTGNRRHPLFFLEPARRWVGRRLGGGGKSKAGAAAAAGGASLRLTGGGGHKGEEEGGAGFGGAVRRALRLSGGGGAHAHAQATVHLSASAPAPAEEPEDVAAEHARVDALCASAPLLDSLSKGTPSSAGGAAAAAAAAGDEEAAAAAAAVYAQHPIIVRDLRRVYRAQDGQPPKLAVRSLNLAIERGECFGLLGPNGAGKSTSINMMVGLLEPTAGTAVIGGHDIRTGMDAIYSAMGVCPQHDLLWDTLTGREHLLFYGRLKGLEGDVLLRAVEQGLRSVNLWNGGVADKAAKQYSGGMKRRLSVAISLVGDPLVVYLDEPSTGLDPASRRNLWDVVRASKRGRAIVLTTHSMEEAETLCDRLGIFVDGQLVCVGNPKEVTSRYGGYYVFTMTVPPHQEARARQFAARRLAPSARLTYSVGGTLKFELPTSEVTLSAVFSAMAAAKARAEAYAQAGMEGLSAPGGGGGGAGGEAEADARERRLLLAAPAGSAAQQPLEVLDWGVANATLEEVFIKFARQIGAKAGD